MILFSNSNVPWQAQFAELFGGCCSCGRLSTVADGVQDKVFALLSSADVSICFAQLRIGFACMACHFSDSATP
jgi:hypothetical protein